jgi:hypothetical protein
MNVLEMIATAAVDRTRCSVAQSHDAIQTRGAEEAPWQMLTAAPVRRPELIEVVIGASIHRLGRG